MVSLILGYFLDSGKHNFLVCLGSYDIVKRKKEVIEKFDSKELEHLLSNSTKNVAQEVVGCLIPAKGKGILNEIEQQTGTQKR